MTRRIRIVALPTATEKHERTVQRRVHGLGRARIVDGYIHHPGWRRQGGGSSGANAQRGTCAASPGPLGKGSATRWFETDAGVLLEAKPVAPVETTRTPRVRVVATSGGGGFGKHCCLPSIVQCFSSLGRLNDCECTNTLAQKLKVVLQAPSPRANSAACQTPATSTEVVHLLQHSNARSSEGARARCIS